MASLTLREFSAAADALDGVTDLEAREARYQTLRTIQPGCVMPEAPVSKGKTARFDAVGASHLRLLQAASSLLAPRAIRRLNGFLTALHETGTPGPQPSKIAVAVEGTAAGQDWTFIINVRHSILRGGVQLDGGLREVNEVRNENADALLAAGTFLHMTVTVPASNLIRPILAALSEH